MNKYGIVLGVAALATLAGCKDPNYAGRRQASAYKDVRSAAVEPAEKPVAVEPAEKPIDITPAVDETKPAKPVIVVEDVATPVPAPVDEVKPVPPPPAPEETTDYVVRPGDYLAKISKRYNIRLDAIRRVNPQLKGDTIRVGQTIKLPGKVDVAAAPAKADKVVPTKKPYAPYTGATTEYTVKSGDFLGKIAQTHKISVRQLKELNGLAGDRLAIGQKLKVPAGVTTAPAAEKRPKLSASEKKAVVTPVEPVSAAPKAVVEPKAVESATEALPAETIPPESVDIDLPADADTPAAELQSYVVQEGDDVTGVALKYGLMQSQIRELNGLTAEDTLVPGQTIKLPADAVLQ